MKNHYFLLSPLLFIICGFLLIGCGSKKSTESQNQLGSIEGSAMVLVPRCDETATYRGMDTLWSPTGIAVRLFNESRTSVVETTRCVSGAYQFQEVKAGTYVVSAQVCDDIKMNGDWSQPFDVTTGKAVQLPSCLFGPYFEEDSSDVFWSRLPYPNPFSPHEGNIRIDYFCSAENSWLLIFFDTFGDTVRAFSGQYIAGYHHLYWDGTDILGVDVESGVYFCELEVSLINPPYSEFVRVKNVMVAEP